MFGQRLHDLRTENAYTQETLGEKLGVSPKTIGTWERGTREPPMKAIDRLAKLFDVSADYLMGRSDKRHYYSLSEKDNQRIDEKIKDILDGLDPEGPDFFKQDAELSDEDKRLLAVSLRQSYALAQELAKKKYTPKKYRGSEK
ncbi:helix-turn-helix domain-containing protein [Lacticaseibacillus paracasei]|uniref:XRE family transcriptional regulator n=1 Tax=Lacticaseibacillus paracasei N1115 TaxID=1446494 RepID=A0A806LAQ4_LACPA|nr:helix-turn-helix transcriptional regulator [Lacticaseibacillus paracasei]AHJ33704.1 XRE family transcriptional regulator [Lacticaseibacillus paracasei N1115]DAZ12193.1 MAG TPA: helix-turn-helix domain protein [Caudoviricetes sp.]